MKISVASVELRSMETVLRVINLRISSSLNRSKEASGLGV